MDQTKTWTWRYENSGGTPVTPMSLPAEVFDSQAEAESWVGEYWRTLLEGGVDAVTLLNGDDVVYGPMSLHPAEG